MKHKKFSFWWKKIPLLRYLFARTFKKKSLLKLKKVPFWWRKYYIENLFILAKRKRYLFGNTFLSQITITFETQKGLFLVKKKVPFQRYVFGTPLKSSFLDHKKVPFLVKKRSLFENGGTILMDFCFKKVPFIKKKVTFHHKNELFYLKKGTDWSVPNFWRDSYIYTPPLWALYQTK